MNTLDERLEAATRRTTLNIPTLIVGAGPVGLTLACELTRYRVPVRIVDEAAQRTDKSKALVLWSRTLELLDRGEKGSAPFVDAGFKVDGVNIVTGDGLAGQLVAGHPGIDKVAFTGSPEVGREVAKSAALWGKRLTLELGGTSANIVCADADIEAAAQGIVEGVFVRQGHACCASSRVFVQ